MSQHLITTESNQFLQNSTHDLVLQVFRYRSPIEFPRHFHDEYSLVICLEGNLCSEQRSVKEFLRTGDVVITSPRVLHASSYAEDGNPTVGLSITIPWERLRAEWQRNRGERTHGYLPLFLGKQSWPGVAERAREILQELDNRKPGYALIAQGLAQRLLSDIVTWWPRELVMLHSPDGVKTLDRWQFVVAVEALGRSLAWRESIAQLSESMGLSPELFRRRFEDSVSMPLEQCSRELVLHFVAKQVDRGDIPLPDLAAQAGFRSSNHLLSALRAASRKTGCIATAKLARPKHRSFRSRSS